MMIFWLLLLGLLWWSPTHAACSGSGLTWSCTAGSTEAQINSAISSASNGAVITLNTGTYSATGIQLSGRNGVTLICQSVGGCTMTGSDAVFELNGCPSARTNLMRISGFNFTTTGNNKIWIYCTFDITKLRLDNLTFTNIGSGNIAIFVGEGGGSLPFADRGKVHGVVDHITCQAQTHNFVCLHNTSGGDQWTTGNLGSSNALFLEDSVCNFGTRTEFAKACVDNWRAHAMVLRFNTIVGSNLRAHSYCHYGPELMEIYGNTISTESVSSPGAWDIHLQGSGEQMVWGNVVSPQGAGASLVPIATQSYRSDSSNLPQGGCTVIADGTRLGSGTPSAPNDGNRTPTSTYYGYPYWHQPGRDGAGTLKPMYSYLNRTRGTGAIAHLAANNSGTWTGLQTNCANNDTDRVNCHIQKNRDLYQETSSFTGASGVGVGPLTSRPASCTPTPELADAGNGGTGYWATDQGSWNQSASNPRGSQFNGADGVLYRCSATNSWTVAYTPYTYPHPLQAEAGGGGGGGGGDTVPPQTPTNLRIQ
jgi:hypothetical protein